jgi:hypothetical protein
VAGTNSRAAKSALIAALVVAYAADDDMTDVVVKYGPGRDLPREFVYGGRVRGQQEFLTFRSAERIPRKEVITIDLHVRVEVPGGDQDESEARACDIGAVVENLIATNTTLNTADVKLLKVTTTDLQSNTDDDGSWSLLTYQVAVESHLT